jgi:hypothetical protein
MQAMDDEPLPLPTAAIAAAYLLALLCLAVPLSVVGSTFAGVVLLRRGLAGHGWAVIVLGVGCMVVGALTLR